MTQTTNLGKIYSYPNNPRVHVSQIAAKYAGVTVETPEFQMGVTNKTPEFMSKFPLGKVPVMDTPEGPLAETEAIAQYVASFSPALVGKSSYDRARVTQFQFMNATELLVHLFKWYGPIAGWSPYNRAAEDKAKEDLRRALTALDVTLKTQTFLVGERISLADISIASSLRMGYTKLFDATFRSMFPNVTRWFVTCMNQPHFLSVLGETVLCESPEVYDAKKFKKDEPKKEVKKEAKKEVKKPAAGNDDEEEDIVPKEEKRKSPLDSLPKSDFVMDEWKRFYSNNDEEASCKWFWEKYDPKGYCIYKVDYKYNSELGAIFMSSNLVGGFFQRLESARKYAFGSVVICGENNANTISGYFLFRGDGIPFEVSDCPDFESYQFTKVNTEDAASRSAFNDYLKWSGPSLPGKMADGKIFK